MDKKPVGILHPGEMGVFVAASVKNSTYPVHWVSEGRSEDSCSRAEEHGLSDTGTIQELCEKSSIILSVCPPHAAENVAFEVMKTGYQGIFVDANAISPSRVIQMSEMMNAAGITFVDGGIVGGPVWEGGKTCLYLSGDSANIVSECFIEGPLKTYILEGPIGKASAVKMSYAAYTKGTTALISSILAMSEFYGVREVLEMQWASDWPDFDVQARQRAVRVTAKAWRFAGEMEEISMTFQNAGLPGGFHASAAEIYRRLSNYKDADPMPDLENVLESLLDVRSEPK